MNEERVERAGRALASSNEYEAGDAGVTDILAGLMHYCDANGIDFGNALRVAESHYDEEV